MVNSGGVNPVVLRVRAEKLDGARLEFVVPAGAAELALPGRRRSGPLGGQCSTRSGKRGGHSLQPGSELVSADTRRAEGVDQRSLIGVTQRHAADQHLVRASANVRQDDF